MLDCVLQAFGTRCLAPSFLHHLLCHEQIEYFIIIMCMVNDKGMKKDINKSS